MRNRIPAPPQYRWWMVTINRKDIAGDNSWFQTIICADTRAQIFDLRPLRRGESVRKVRPITGLSARIETFRNRPTPHEVNQLLGECADLLQGGVKLADALALQMRRSPNPIIRYHLARVLPLLRAGVALHDAFGREEAICDQRLGAILRAAESSGGKLIDTLKELKGESEYTVFVQQTVSRMCIYPYIVQWFIVGLLFVFSSKIVPAVSEFYRQFNHPLPWFARAHYPALVFYGHHPIFWSVLLSGLLLWVFVYHKRIVQHPFVRRWMYRLPRIGRFRENNDMVVAASHFAVAQKAGLTVVESLDVTQGVLKKKAMAMAWARVAHECRNGATLSRVVESYAIEFGELGEEFAAVLQAGEDSRDMPARTKELSERLRQRMTSETAALPEKVGPMITLFLMVEVMFLLLPVIVPLLRMGEVIRPSMEKSAVQNQAVAEMSAPAVPGNPPPPAHPQ